ncbi:RNA polymerase sigma factor [Riemerella columbipharyngis]|uniref:RNA polymerase sigma factor, sigma-70 family n=1 Tax=Riemerella columbipharyngis TaxID=1071918 RepID=A0A1G7EMC3_9FLAO|nr:sigma-70 family RNA polymerase sigma factor [Riemerella columbipharyngis]SDE64779.1 RNA polymerase sigma factor, sigma-70 family [Riemerella columbipharyngis]
MEGQNIIWRLKNQDNHSFGLLYENYFDMVNRFVTKNSGRTSDAEDIFQDTMVVLISKLNRDDFQLTASIKTYIMAIAKNLWLKKLRKTYREVEFTENYTDAFFEEITESIEQEKSYREKLRSYMGKITAHCRKLIYEIFFKEKSTQQIQQEYGYSSRHNVNNQKYKCIEQIRRAKIKLEK